MKKLLVISVALVVGGYGFGQNDTSKSQFTNTTPCTEYELDYTPPQNVVIKSKKEYRKFPFISTLQNIRDIDFEKYSLIGLAGYRLTGTQKIKCSYYYDAKENAVYHFSIISGKPASFQKCLPKSHYWKHWCLIPIYSNRIAFRENPILKVVNILIVNYLC